MLVTFSDKTEILGFNHASFLDEIVTVKVRMPISDVDEFIKTSPFKGVQLRDDRRYVHTDESLTWMDPEGAVRFKSGQVTIRDTQGLNILIDLDDNEQAIVYLEWFTT